MTLTRPPRGALKPAVHTRNIIRAHDSLVCAVHLLMCKNKRMSTNPRRGPFHQRAPADMLMRTIRGMLPHKLFRGSAAYQRIKAVDGCPAPFDKIKKMVVPSALR